MMLRPDRGIERVYLHRAPVDMRRGRNGLPGAESVRGRGVEAKLQGGAVEQLFL